jgi:hypothetical protein
LEVWGLSENTFCFYTRDKHQAKAAKLAGLCLMAEYTKGGRIFALQFAGPKEKVLAVVHHPVKKDQPINLPLRDQEEVAARKLFGEPEKPKPRKVCGRCKQPFEAANNRQQYCTKCRKWAKREGARERKQRQRRKAE